MLQKLAKKIKPGSTKNGAQPYDLLGMFVSLYTTQTANLLDQVLSVIFKLGPDPINSIVGAPGAEASNVVAIS